MFFLIEEERESPDQAHHHTYVRTRGTSEEAAKKAKKRRLGDEGKASLRPAERRGGMKEGGSTACRFLPERGMSGGGIR